MSTANSHPTDEAIVVRGVVKQFKRRTIRHQYTSFKTELVGWITGRRKKNPMRFIEALRGVDFTIRKGRTVGILGRNGSGKSTLLKLITGIYSPTAGTVEVHGRISALLDLGAGFHPEFSGRENILINGIILGMTRAEVKSRMDDIIAFGELGEFIDEPVRTYSSGMYMRLAFSVATHVDPEILIIDEILAVGDEHFGKKSRAKMEEFKRAGKTIVLVTHDLGTVKDWCDEALWIDGGRIRAQGAPGPLVAEYRAAVLAAEQQGTNLTPAALAADGGALPPVAAVASGATTSAPLATLEVVRPEPDARGPRLTSLVLERLDGTRIQECREGEAIGVRVAWEGALDLAIPSLRVELRTSTGGRLVAVTSERAGGSVLASPLPESGEVRVSFESLAVHPGSYRVEVQLRPTAAVEGGPRLHAALEVAPAGGDGRLLPLSARWECLDGQALSSVGT